MQRQATVSRKTGKGTIRRHELRAEKKVILRNEDERVLVNELFKRGWPAEIAKGTLGFVRWLLKMARENCLEVEKEFGSGIPRILINSTVAFVMGREIWLDAAKSQDYGAGERFRKVFPGAIDGLGTSIIVRLPPEAEGFDHYSPINDYQRGLRGSYRDAFSTFDVPLEGKALLAKLRSFNYPDGLSGKAAHFLEFLGTINGLETAEEYGRYSISGPVDGQRIMVDMSGRGMCFYGNADSFVGRKFKEVFPESAEAFQDGWTVVSPNYAHVEPVIRARTPE